MWLAPSRYDLALLLYFLRHIVPIVSASAHSQYMALLCAQWTANLGLSVDETASCGVLNAVASFVGTLFIAGVGRLGLSAGANVVIYASVISAGCCASYFCRDVQPVPTLYTVARDRSGAVSRAFPARWKQLSLRYERQHLYDRASAKAPASLRPNHQRAASKPRLSLASTEVHTTTERSSIDSDSAGAANGSDNL
jgi:hypothetical protein